MYAGVLLEIKAMKEAIGATICSPAYFGLVHNFSGKLFIGVVCLSIVCRIMKKDKLTANKLNNNI